MATDDEDDSGVFEDAPTRIDEAAPLPDPERDTSAYNSLEFLAGREAGFEAGLRQGFDTAIAALRVELVRAGCTEEEIKSILSRVRVGTAEPR